MKKRILTILLSVCLILSLAVPAMAVNTEDSVIQTVRVLGIMNGDQNGNLNLNSHVTRAELAKMLVAASAYKDTIGEGGSGYSLFKDVKSSHWASEYIRLAVQEGWMTGYTDGAFRPDQAVTLEEACAALLRLLGYDSASLAGSFPQAQLSKASALGLRDQVSVVRGTKLTRRDCAYLFYNLLTAQNSSGQVYATSLGYTVTNGEIDLNTVIIDGMSGPYVAEAGEALPLSAPTVYRDGRLDAVSSLEQYDVYYYSRTANTVWIYTERVSGEVTGLSPSETSPTSVTISGNTYEIGTSTAANKLSSLSGGSSETVTLLLGMDSAVVDVLLGDEVSGVYYGVLRSSERDAGSSGNASARTTLTVFCTDGITRTFTVDKAVEYSDGALLSVTLSADGAAVKSLSAKSVSGQVNSSASKLGSLPFASNIHILDTTAEGDAVQVDPERLGGKSLSGTDVRYYVCNESGEITHLILNNVTGDLWEYGFVLSSSSQGGMSLSSSYSCVIDGTVTTLKTDGASYPVKAGTAVGIRDNADGTVKEMRSLASVRLTDLTSYTASASNTQYPVWTDVQVYLLQDGNYYLTDISNIDGEDYLLTGWYDNFGCHAGGQIRVIIATAK